MTCARRQLRRFWASFPTADLGILSRHSLEATSFEKLQTFTQVAEYSVAGFESLPSCRRSPTGRLGLGARLEMVSAEFSGIPCWYFRCQATEDAPIAGLAFVEASSRWQLNGRRPQLVTQTRQQGGFFPVDPPRPSFVHGLTRDKHICPTRAKRKQMLPAKSRLPTQQAVHAPGYHPWRVTSFQRGLAQRRQTTQSAARRGERWDGSAMLGRGVHPRIIGIFTAGTPTSRHLRSCTGHWPPTPPGGGEEALGLSSVPVPGVLGPPWAGRHNFPHQRRPPPTSPIRARRRRDPTVWFNSLELRHSLAHLLDAPYEFYSRSTSSAAYTPDLALTPWRLRVRHTMNWGFSRPSTGPNRCVPFVAPTVNHANMTTALGLRLLRRRPR